MEINAGSLVGVGSGAIAGAQIGAPLGPIGTIAGGVVGAIAGFFGGGGGGSTTTPSYDATVSKPNRGSADTEYVQAVNNEKQSEYDIAQAALKKVSPYDTQTISQIQSKFNQAMSDWGDPNNPNRNVARPDVFKSEMQSVLDKYVDPYAAAVAPASTSAVTTDTFSLAFSPDGSPAFFNKATNQYVPINQQPAQVITQTAPLGTSSIETYMPYIVAGLGLIALFFILKKK